MVIKVVLPLQYSPLCQARSRSIERDSQASADSAAHPLAAEWSERRILATVLIPKCGSLEGVQRFGIPPLVVS